ncbi:MAG: response regulator [Bacillota bacterium]|nr:response regulator [Bacillota bacterium]
MQKILIIDDTKNIRLMLTKCLELEGYHVTTANDGKEALELFKKEKFDLAFLDIKLPEIRGTEVLKRIRDMGIITPVIIITAYGTVKNAVDCTNMGAIAYLQKPFTAEKIKTVLKELNFKLNSESGLSSIDRYIVQIEELIDNSLFHDALIQLKKAVSLDPANPKIQLLFSKAYKAIGNEEYSEKFYQAYQIFSK